MVQIIVCKLDEKLQDFLVVDAIIQYKESIKGWGWGWGWFGIIRILIQLFRFLVQFKCQVLQIQK